MGFLDPDSENVLRRRIGWPKQGRANFRPRAPIVSQHTARWQRGTYYGTMSQSPTVLVVDDVPLNRLMITLALRQIGCQVVEAGDGAEALAALAREKFVLVVMDCQMPVLDGLAATRLIRAACLRVPILAYTAEDNRDDCLAAGMNDYLAKPAPLGQLKAKLISWIERAAA